MYLNVLSGGGSGSNKDTTSGEEEKGGGKGKGKPKLRRLAKPEPEGEPQSAYQHVIFSHESFLYMYNQKLEKLVDDSLGSIVHKASNYLDRMKPELSPLIEKDGTWLEALGSFDVMKAWLSERQSIVAGQICEESTSSGTSCLSEETVV